MNKILIRGRITKDLVIKYTNSNKAILKFTVAVNRSFKNASGEYEADFINCVAFEQKAEFIAKYFEKGSEIIIEGRLQTGSYDDEKGVKHYTTDLMVEQAEFCGTKKQDNLVKPSDFEKEETNPFQDFGDTIKIEDDFLE